MRLLIISFLVLCASSLSAQEVYEKNSSPVKILPESPISVSGSKDKPLTRIMKPNRGEKIAYIYRGSVDEEVVSEYDEIEQLRFFLEQQDSGLVEIKPEDRIKTAKHSRRSSKFQLQSVSLDYDEKNSDRAPMDNSIAINSSGEIFVADNYSVTMLNARGEPISEKVSLHDFFGNFLTSPCDPKVIYDSNSDRFMLFAQECNAATNKSTPRTCLAVSSSDDNLFEDWVFYTIDGVKGYTFDYPKIATTNTELLITGTMYNASSIMAVVYQVDKESLLSNDKDAIVKTWNFHRASVGFVMPVTSYEKCEDPGKFETPYLLGTNWTNGVKKSWLYRIDVPCKEFSGEMQRFFIDRDYPVRHFRFGEQKDGKRVDNFDLRMMDAYLKDGSIAYVFTNGNKNGYSKIDLNLLDLKTLTNKSMLIGIEPQTSYSHPSLEWIRNKKGESETLMLFFAGTSKYDFPKLYGAEVDPKEWSSTEYVVDISNGPLVKTFNNPEMSHICRWGDYTTIVRSPNENSLVMIGSTLFKENGKSVLRSSMHKISFKGEKSTKFSKNKVVDSQDLSINVESYLQLSDSLLSIYFLHDGDKLSLQELNKLLDYNVNEISTTILFRKEDKIMLEIIDVNSDLKQEVIDLNELVGK